MQSRMEKLMVENKIPWIKPCQFSIKNQVMWGFPEGSVVKNPPANTGDRGSISDSGRSHTPWNS